MSLRKGRQITKIFLLLFYDKTVNEITIWSKCTARYLTKIHYQLIHQAGRQIIWTSSKNQIHFQGSFKLSFFITPRMSFIIPEEVTGSEIEPTLFERAKLRMLIWNFQSTSTHYVILWVSVKCINLYVPYVLWRTGKRTSMMDSLI